MNNISSNGMYVESLIVLKMTHLFSNTEESIENSENPISELLRPVSCQIIVKLYCMVKSV